MNKRELDLLERAFVSEIRSALEGGPGLIQPRGKLVEKMAAEGYLQACTEVLSGRFPVTLHGYRLTHAGRLAYCMSCGTDDDEAAAEIEAMAKRVGQ